MKTYVVYAHYTMMNVITHRPFTQLYAYSIEEAVDNFCYYLKEKFPSDQIFDFCLQEVTWDDGQQLYMPSSDFLNVNITELHTRQMTTRWVEDHV